MNRAKFPPVEISPPVEDCSISPSDSVSFITVSPGAFCSIAGASWPIASMPSGLVSVNSTDSGTDGVERADAGEEAIEGMAVSPGACWAVLAAADMASCAGAVMGNVRMIDMASCTGAVMGRDVHT